MDKNLTQTKPPEAESPLEDSQIQDPQTQDPNMADPRLTDVQEANEPKTNPEISDSELKDPEISDPQPFDSSETESDKITGPEKVALMDSTPSGQEKKPKHNFAQTLALVLILAVVGGFSIGAGGMFMKEYMIKEKSSQTPPITTQPASNPTVPIAYSNGAVDIAAIVEEVGSSVVSINSNIAYRDFFNMERTTQASGSGVIFSVNSESIDIMTNEHVVEDASEVFVQLSTDQYFKAEIIGKDKSTDLAILRISAIDLTPEILGSLKAAKFGDSDAIRVGEIAIAIGNPLGYDSTVTVGVISAVDREIKDKNSLKLIQTDAAINPGNSGGALVNSRGEVIGINTIKIADTQVEGIGFAIPSNSAVPVVNELVSKGFVSRPYLGIYGAEITKEASATYDMPVGIYVRGLIEGSGAEKAGIKAGDVITAINGTRIETMAQLTESLAKHEVGDKIKVSLVRESGQNIELEVTLMDVNS